jgi:molecular chaperone GrpE
MTESPEPDITPAGGEEVADGAGPRSAETAGPLSDAALTELLNRYTRLAADFDNYRKRTAREQADRARYAAEPAARALLPVLDNLRRAVDHAPADGDPGLLDGLQFTVRQFEEALASVGVVPIEALGAPFDTAEHEAVMGEERDDVEVDTVVEELQRGYRIGERVIRPAMVKVAHPRHVAVRGGGAPRAAAPATPPANGAVHHDLPASPEKPDASAGEGWVEA